MPDFLFNISFYVLFLTIVITFANVLKRAWSTEVINKEPEALATNNILILLVLVLSIFMLIVFGWLALSLSFIACFTLWIIVSRKIVKHSIDNLIEEALTNQNDSPNK